MELQGSGEELEGWRGGVARLLNCYSNKVFLELQTSPSYK